jgi:tetratricopeptide (TPR) repeat protein
LEKLPLLALSVASSVATVHAQGIAVGTLEKYSMGVRVANAADAYLTYVMQAAVPVDLAAFYPHPGAGLPAWRAAAGAALLVGGTLGAWALRRGRPYLLVGWLWYLGMLVPVIGLVQVGGQAHADRYTYLPQVGLWVALAWALADIPRRTEVVAAAALVFAALSFQQVGYWRNNLTLFSHAIECTTGNYVAHGAYGHALMTAGRFDEAAFHLRQAIEIRDDFEAHNNLGCVYIEKRQLDEAASEFRRVLELAPGHPRARSNLVLVLTLRGYQMDQKNRPAEAVANFEELLSMEPDAPEAPGVRVRLAVQYLKLSAEAEGKGQRAESLRLARKAAEHDPNNAEARKRVAELEKANAP